MAGQLVRRLAGLRLGSSLSPSLLASAAPAPLKLPTAERRSLEAPPEGRLPLAIHVPNLDSALREILDPSLPSLVPLGEPESGGRNAPMEATWIRRVKHRKVKKHKRIKRWRRDRHRLRNEFWAWEAKEEREFETAMSAKLSELSTFAPSAYVRETIGKAKAKPPERRPSGGAVYPHWSTLVKVEELYGLPHDSRIDKAAGLPSDEDWAETLELRKKYYKDFQGRDVDDQPLWNKKKASN